MFVNEKHEPSKRWRTFDVERGISLNAISVPGYPDGEPLYKFELNIRDVRIIFAGSYSPRPIREYKSGEIPQYDLSWVLRRFQIPEGLSLTELDVLKIISEALQVWGNGYNPARTRNVTVKLSENEMGWYVPHHTVRYWD